MDDTPGRMRNETDDVIGRATEHARGAAPDDGGTVDERTREIRHEIEETRVEMAETIDAIQEKLKPRNVVASATDRVKNAATERVREMADTASHTAQQAMDYTRRQNPIPLALIGVGAAWLLTNRSRRASYGRGGYGMRRDPREYGDWTRDEARYGEYGEYGERGLMARIRNNPIPATLAGVGLSWLAFSSNEPGDREYAARWGGSREGSSAGRSETASVEGGMTQDLSDSASQVASRTREYASDATDSVRRMVRRRQHQLERMIQDNPLLVGAGALMLGAAFGMAVPETETENELMGEARDNMVDRAREVARDAATQVQNAAGTVADAAGKVAEKSQP